MKLRSLVQIAAFSAVSFLGACGNLTVTDDCACGFFATEGGRLMIWPSEKKEVTLYLHSSIPSNAKAAIFAAAKTYNDAIGNEITITIKDNDANSPIHGQSSDQATVQGDGINGIYWVPSGWTFGNDGESHEDGVTLVQFAKSGIRETDVYIRGESFTALNSSTANTDAQTSDYQTFDKSTASVTENKLYLLMTHELGHVLGRVHTNQAGSIMQPTIGFDSLKDPLSSYDLDLLESAYK